MGGVGLLPRGHNGDTPLLLACREAKQKEKRNGVNWRGGSRISWKIHLWRQAE